MKATLAVFSLVLVVALAWACGRTATKCITDQDCASSSTSVCSHCPAFQNDLICWQADCLCACDVDGGAGSPDAGCTRDSDCPNGGVDTCNVCVSPLDHFVCSDGKCVCACQVVDAG